MNWLASPRYAVVTIIESFLLPLRWNLFIYSCVAIFGCDERICPIGMSQRYPLNVTCRLGLLEPGGSHNFPKLIQPVKASERVTFNSDDT